MLHSLHVIDPKRALSNADFASGNYPITLNLEQFLDFFNFVKAIDVSIFTVNTQTGGLPSNIFEAAGANIGGQQILSFSARLQRIIKPVGLLNADGTSLETPPSAQIDYPFFSGGGIGGLVQIDFGKTRVLNGLFFPYIDIITNNGANLGAGHIVGLVNFENYGSISLKSNDNILGGGSIRVAERYDSLTLSRLLVSPLDNLTVVSGATLTELERYTVAYIGPRKVDVTASGDSLSLTLPREITNGPIRFETDGATRFDSFRTFFELKKA